MNKRWIFVGVLVILLVCFCLVVVVGGGLAAYLFLENKSVMRLGIEDDASIKFPETINNGLEAYWSFDNCNAEDRSGHGFQGTLYGDPECVDGIVGKAFEFDGTGDWFGLQSVPAEVYHLKDFSVSLWFNTDQDVTQTLLQGSDGHAWGLEGYGIVVTSFRDIEAGYRVQGPDKCEMHALTNLEADTWHHVVLVRNTDKQEGHLFVDGKLAGSCQDPDPHSFVRPQSYPRIGYGFYAPNGYEKYFDGIIDEIRLYRRALTAEEIAMLFENQD
ncbi:MAG: LamG domain-containing protein [Chloroflexota bacterium]